MNGSAIPGSIGVVDFDVVLLVNGGDDEGSSIACFRRAMMLLKQLCHVLIVSSELDKLRYKS